MGRPTWCQDPTCTPDAMANNFCCGRTADLMVTERQGIRHENDGHFCIQSPRGVVMLEVCEADLEVIARNALRGLVARDPERVFNPRWYTGRKAWPAAEGGTP